MPDEKPIDPFLHLPVDVAAVQPFQARKLYVCPACNTDIPVGMGHVVVVPIDAADLRRHWHKACWANRATLSKRTRPLKRKLR